MSDSTRETLTELGDRARGIVEELARKAAERRQQGAETTAQAADETVGPSDIAGLGQRLGELRACVGEVADVLEAAVERLETVEQQLGDPDESLERQLRESLERCERVLMGIELRVERAAAAAQPHAVAVDVAEEPAPVVLVVAASSAHRGALCLALERQGIRTLAACDLGAALAIAARRHPPVALVDPVGFGSSERDAADFLDEWMEYQEHGSLPKAAVLDATAPQAAALGWPTIRSAHGEAAMAASLVRLAADETSNQEQQA